MSLRLTIRHVKAPQVLRLTPRANMRSGWAITAALSAVITGLLAACEQVDPSAAQGYVEGEFLYAAAPLAGHLTQLNVERGARVTTGARLFALEDTPERTARDQTLGRVQQAQALLRDAQQEQRRPTELKALRAQLDHARSALSLAERELLRQRKLSNSAALAERELDRALAQRDQAQADVARLSADLKTAQLGARDAQIAAAADNLQAQQAALDSAEWSLAQKTQTAPAAALVSDVLFRPGEWVAAGQPVVVLLPANRVKVRAFVPEQTFGRIQPGAEAQVHVDGVARALPARVSFLSPRAEYTPPVIYSQQMREKFVFLVELALAPELAAGLHPGQPVDVHFQLTR